jgi:hypothetical protein
MEQGSHDIHASPERKAVHTYRRASTSFELFHEGLLEIWAGFGFETWLVTTTRSARSVIQWDWLARKS